MAATAHDVEPIRVEHLAGDRFALQIRGHEVVVDQPIEEGGNDTGPTPTELFVASLAACVAFYVRRYLARHGFPTEGLTVEARASFATNPTRVGHISLDVGVGSPLDDELRARLHTVARRCTIHNTLGSPPEIDLEIKERETAQVHETRPGD
ncbi:MAG: OsmC family protein [Acidothermus sp.]|nr:OsmC family protein [Acidothermus sp.]MCL6538598.1 OsmC family protein [Acidothermus sp.]